MKQKEKEDYTEVPVRLETYIFRVLNPCVSAQLHSPDLELEENARNDAILALPPFLEREEIIREMRIALSIAHSDAFREWPLQRKILGIEHIMQILVLMPELLEVYDWMHVALRHRYRDAAPTDFLRRQLQENYEAAQSAKATVIQKPVRSHSFCRFVSGLSGVGKTTMIVMVLSMFPMMIEHETFGGLPSPFVQVVWILVSCPPTGSVETLMKGILYWFDFNLGTKYMEEMRARSRIYDYIQKVKIVLRTHMVGMIIVDEIQFALRANDKTWMIDFVTTLFNENCCVFVLIGTPDAEGYLMTSTMRNIRRALSGGRTVISPCVFGREWARVAREIIRIDFLPCPPSSVSAIRKTLFVVSAGLISFAKLAWETTQYVGLRTGARQVTTELIMQSVAETFYPISGLLDALRRRDYLKLMDFEDMATAEVQKVKASLQRMRDRGDGDGKRETEERANIFGHCVATLVDLDYTQVEAEALIRRLMQENPEWKGKDVLRAALASVAQSEGEAPEADEKPRTPSGGASQNSKAGVARKRQGKRQGKFGS